MSYLDSEFDYYHFINNAIYMPNKIGKLLTSL